ncbi:GntR family transcriptional regulator [Bradyrhizobium sp. Arg237L]|nr:GntR family transcriptional regulator [Bradyrhizobium sp. Arg237L]MDI4237597.1 GntR family transcriptional regulator [Bradyrhizobium sp. Arg237L]
MAVLPIQLDRARRTPLAAQIYCAIRESIENGRLASGPRLPYWRDLVTNLNERRLAADCRRLLKLARSHCEMNVAAK